MGKGSKTRARALKLAKKHDLPELAPVPRPKKTGGARMQELEAMGLAERVGKRAKRLGLPFTDAVLRAMQGQHLGCEAGFAIHIGCDCEKERAELYGIVADWRRLESRFLGTVVGRKVYSWRDSIPHVPEPMQTRDDFDHDDRSEEEKAESARKAWARFCENTDILSRRESALLWDAVWEVSEGRLVRDAIGDQRATLTSGGVIFMRSLRRLAQHIDRQG